MIRINNLTYSYGKKSNSKKILSNINVCFEQNKLYAVLGNNGCGKSTFLKCIDGICKNFSVSVFGKHTLDNNYADSKPDNLTLQLKQDYVNVSQLDARQRAKLISYCPQNSLANSLCVFDYVMLGRKPYISFSPSKHDKSVVNDMIEKFDLSKYTATPVNKLSGGEFQRVVIATTFAQKSRVMLLDEPTNNLDVAHQHNLMHFLQHSAKDHNNCVICVLHDINMALTHADEILFMKDGKIEHQCSPETINENILMRVYGVEAQVMNIKGYKAVFI